MTVFGIEHRRAYIARMSRGPSRIKDLRVSLDVLLIHYNYNNHKNKKYGNN